MEGLSARDGQRDIDWGKTSTDYSLHRPGYPDGFYEQLWTLGVGRPGQRVLDLGTGTGNLARALAARGAQVTGIDVATQQVAAARDLTEQIGLSIDFHACPVEESGLPDASFDLAIAGQCWLYFDAQRMISELRRMLVGGGRLLTTHFSWLPRLDDIARRSEEIVLRHNPEWTAGDWHGDVPAVPAWSREEGVPVLAWFAYDEAIPFTHESWRGRLRACRGTGATLSPLALEAFDTEHARMLQQTCPDEFTVLHRIDAHLFDLGLNT